MNRSSHGGSQVRGAAGDKSKYRVAHENFLDFFDFLDSFFNSFDSSAESFKNFSNIPAIFHRDYSKVVSFIDPEYKVFAFRNKDSSSLRPASMVPRRSLHLVFSSKKKVVINKLLLFSLRHGRVSIKISLKVFRQSLYHLFHQISNVYSGLSGSTRIKREKIKVSRHSDTS